MLFLLLSALPHADIFVFEIAHEGGLSVEVARREAGKGTTVRTAEVASRDEDNMRRIRHHGTGDVRAKDVRCHEGGGLLVNDGLRLR